MRSQQATTDWLGLNWQLSPTSGWGLLGLNLALEAESDGRLKAVPMVKMLLAQEVPDRYSASIARITSREDFVQRLLIQHAGQVCQCDFPVIHALGNRLASTDPAERIRGCVNLAIIFFEDTELTASAHDTAARFATILAGSGWNARVLKSRGIGNVRTFLQGVDLSLFSPDRSTARPKDRFLVFSGGKLEYRKGQDIVVAAFREFHKKHPDAMLVTAWHNHWPKSMIGIERRGYVHGLPEDLGGGRLDIAGWLERNGIPKRASHVVGLVPNRLMPKVYHQIDVALFPNRCEGGTNLTAMECLACGVPTILSANTGHLDLVDEGHCYPLFAQGPVTPVAPVRATDGWGESDVGEVVEMLERVYTDRNDAKRKADAAVRAMQSWSWRTRFLELYEILESLA